MKRIAEIRKAKTHTTGKSFARKLLARKAIFHENRPLPKLAVNNLLVTRASFRHPASRIDNVLMLMRNEEIGLFPEGTTGRLSPR
jgi:hypothetical protein